MNKRLYNLNEAEKLVGRFFECQEHMELKGPAEDDLPFNFNNVDQTYMVASTTTGYTTKLIGPPGQCVDDDSHAALALL